MDFMKNLKNKTEILTDIKVEQIALSEITPDKEQVRKKFNDDTLQDLAASIKQKGIQNPIHVLFNEEKKYTIIMGERRYRASQIAGLELVPCIVHREKVEAKEIKALQLIENLQREDLTGIETARGFLSLKENGVSQSQVARELGVSEGYVSKGLTILKKIPSDWLKQIEEKQSKASIYDIYNNIAKITNKKKQETAFYRFIGEEKESELKEDNEPKEKKETIIFTEQDYQDVWEKLKVIVKRDKSKLSKFITNKKLQEILEDNNEE